MLTFDIASGLFIIGRGIFGLRSFCEVVIVGQLDRWPDHL